MEQTKVRQSNFELLRIVLMFMVVVLHVLYHGILSPELILNSDNKQNIFCGMALESICIIAVNCYILISGYFGIYFNFRKLFKLVFMMWFYSIVLYIIFVLLGIEPFSIIGIVKSNVPLFWWFMYYYIILLLLSPFINFIVEKMSKRMFKMLIILMFMLFCFVPTFSPFSFTNDRGFGIINFVFLYLIGAYIKKWYIDKHETIWWVCLYLISALLIMVGNWGIIQYFGIYQGWLSHFFGYDTLFVLGGSFAFFMLFKCIKLKHSSVINYASKAMLGVYLIHEHKLIREYIYYNILHIDKYFNDRYFIFSTILIALIIFSICILIEIIRLKLTSRVEDRIIEYFESRNHLPRVKSYINSFLEK